MAIATDLGKWVRPHAKLPKKPRISDTNKPLTEKELLMMFDSLDSWTRRPKYDHYFCAGELVAGLCRGMDVVFKRFKLCDDETKLKIFGHCVYFYYQEFLQMFDGSDGIWQIAEARILKMAEEIRKLKDKKDIKEKAWEELRNKLDKAGEGWGVGAKDFL